MKHATLRPEQAYPASPVPDWGLIALDNGGEPTKPRTKQVVPHDIEVLPKGEKVDIYKQARETYDTRLRRYGPAGSRHYEVMHFSSPVKARTGPGQCRRGANSRSAEAHYRSAEDGEQVSADLRDWWQESIARSRRSIRQFIHCLKRERCKMFTFTYRTEPSDEQAMVADMRACLERLNSHTHQKINVLWVYERGGKNGRLHVHGVVECGYIPVETWREDIWGLGWVFIRKCQSREPGKNVGRMVHYITKYITKDAVSGVKARHRYHRTRHSAYMCRQDVGDADLSKADFEAMRDECVKLGITTNYWHHTTSFVGEVCCLSSYDDRFIEFIKGKMALVKCRRRTLEPLFTMDSHYQQSISYPSSVWGKNTPIEYVGFGC